MASLRTRLLAAALIACQLPAAFAVDPHPVTSSTANSTAKPKSITECVAEPYRDTVAGILKAPTISAKAADEDFTAHPNVYDWLVEHPDRTTQAWKRLKIPCVDITDLGKGQFFWSDETGSELTWQTVGRFENGLVWYATGKVKPSPLLPTIPVKAVAVLHAPRGKADRETGQAALKPTVQIYLVSESRVAAGLVKMMGPSAPKMAEESAEQFLFFFSGIARYIARKPEQLEPLLAPAKK